MFFSLEPSLRYALINYLQRTQQQQVPDNQLYFISILELITLYEMEEHDEVLTKQIYELYNAVTNFRLITFSRRHGTENDAIKSRSKSLKHTDYYLNLMEIVVEKLLNKLNDNYLERRCASA